MRRDGGLLIWTPVADARATTLLALAADYRELLRVDVTGASAWRPPAAVAEQLRRQDACHFVLQHERAEGPARSALATFDWR